MTFQQSDFTTAFDTIQVRLYRHAVQASPKMVSVELTSACNLSCKMCPLTLGLSSTSAHVSYISDVVWARVLDGLGPEVERVLLTGFGEPMLHPRLPQLISGLNAKNIVYGMSTNGTVMRNTMRDLLPRLHNLAHLNVSVDSFDPDIYREIRGGKIETCLRNIALIRDLMPAGATLTVSALLMPKTLPSLIEAPRILAGLGVQHLVLQSLFDQSTDGLDAHLDAQAHHKT